MNRREFLITTGLSGSVLLLRPDFSRMAAAHAAVPENADSLLDAALDAARDSGADFAEAMILHQRSQSLQVRKTDLVPTGDNSSSGIALRVRAGSGWGFAANSMFDAFSAGALASAAVAMARATGAVKYGTFVPERRVRSKSTWSTPGAVDPFTVPFSEKREFLLRLSSTPLEHPQIAFSVANLFQVKREQRYRNSLGGDTVQTTFVCYPNFAVTAFDRASGNIDSRSSFLEAGGYGWEITKEHNFNSELMTAMNEVLEAQAAPPVEEGRTALVIDPSALWHIIYETLAHHLDPRSSLGLDGRRPGDTWITRGKVGSAVLGSSSLTLDFDSTLARGLATAGWDDCGMPASSGTLVDGGILARLPGSESTMLPDTPPEFLHAGMSAWNVAPEFAMPNLVLRSASQRKLEDLISDAGTGYLVKGRGQVLINSSRTLFRYRPQLAWRIKGGRTDGMVRDLEIEMPVEQFWNALVDVGADSARLTAGDMFPQNRNALWDTPFSVSTPPARFTDIPVFRTQKG